jgi:hypothetical protein
MHAYKLQEQGVTRSTPIWIWAADRCAQLRRRRPDPDRSRITTLRLMSNNPAKFVELEGYALRIVGRVPLVIAPNAENRDYLRAKQLRLGHQLELA